jgi:hypothetical protein
LNDAPEYHLGMTTLLDDALFLSTAEVARALGRHPRTLRNWRVENTGPIAVKIGHKWAYPRSSVADYIDGLVAGAAQAREECPVMAAEDFVSRSQFAEEDINALGSESPPRPTMQSGEHMNADQFRGNRTASELPPPTPNVVRVVTDRDRGTATEGAVVSSQQQSTSGNNQEA